MDVPYQAIGMGLGFLLGIWAFIEAETVGARILIVGTMAASLRTVLGG